MKFGIWIFLESPSRNFVCPFVLPHRWNSFAPTGRIFMKFGIWTFFESPSRKFACPTVRPSAQMKQLCSHWTDFHEIWYLDIFRKSIEKIRLSIRPSFRPDETALLPLDGFSWNLIFGHFSKVHREISSVHPSVLPHTWNNFAPTGRILMKFGIWIFLESPSRNFVCPSVLPHRWNIFAPTGRIFMKFGIWTSFESPSRKFVCPSVRPSAQMKQLCSHWTDFHEIWYLNIFRKSIEKFRLSIRPSFHPHETTLLPLDKFSWNLIFEYFSKAYRENSSSLKIWQ